MYCPNRDCPDFKDTGKPGEYREGITHCPYCRSALVAEDPLRAAPPARAGSQPEPGGEWGPGGQAAAPGGDELEVPGRVLHALEDGRGAEAHCGGELHVRNAPLRL